MEMSNLNLSNLKNNQMNGQRYEISIRELSEAERLRTALKEVVVEETIEETGEDVEMNAE